MDKAEGAELRDAEPMLTADEHTFIRAALVVRTYYPHVRDATPGFDESILERIGRTPIVGPLSAIDLAEAEHAVCCCLDELRADASFSVDFYIVGLVPPEKSRDVEKHLTALAALLGVRVDALGGASLRAQAVALRAQRAVEERDAFFASREAARPCATGPRLGGRERCGSGLEGCAAKQGD